MSGKGNWKISSLLFCLILVGTASTATWHFHLEDSQLQISAEEHESECVFCEHGVSTSFAIPHSLIQLTTNLVLKVSLDYEFHFSQSVYSAYSARAPPS